MHKPQAPSIKQSLTRVIMLTSCVALLVASSCFAALDLVTMREAKVRDLTTLARMIGSNTQGALAFADENQAEETLAAVRAKPYILSAAVYKDRRLFASYLSPGRGGSAPKIPPADGSRIEGGNLVLTQPILLDQDRIGTVYLQESMADITVRLQRYAGIAVLILIVSILVALLLSSRLQRGVTDPILELAHTASLVSSQSNYSIRAKKRKNDEIGVLIESFNAMLAQIERSDLALQELNAQLAASEKQALAANQAKSAFLARMSHELRTPLNAIIGYSEMLQEEVEDTGDAALLPDLRKINSAGKHLLSLINDILDLSKVEAGKTDLFLETFDLAPVIQDVTTTVAPLVDKNRNTLKVTCGADLGTVYADLTKLRQMLFNLLSNASKFTEEGVIRLQATRVAQDGKDWIALSVSDTGIGMSPDQVEKVFDAFVQADASTTRKYGGTGLGLAITQRFAQMMGGSVTVKSRLGEGTTFTLRIPAEVVREEPAPPPDPSREPLVATVLAIDDDAEARDLMQRLLSKEGYRVVPAAGGLEGLQKAREIRPDVITLDVMMPGMDGWAVLSELKADPDLAQIPVIMITMMDSQNIGYALGAADFLTKPLSRERLVGVLSKIGRPGRGSTVLVVDDDPGVRLLLRRFLETEEWTICEAENGKVALERLQRDTPALILLDLMMPVMDGFEFVECLRSRPEWTSIPIVIVTACDLREEDRRRLNGGVHRILQKGSYSREDVLQCVRSAIRGFRLAEASGEG